MIPRQLAKRMTEKKPADTDKEAEQPFVTHLMELRDRLLRCVITVLVLFLCLLPFANHLYTLLAGPLLAHLPEGSTMIATKVISPFLTPLKLALVSAIFIAIPVLLYQIWGFVAPGLYKNERKMVIPLLFSSTVLFYTGMAFAYFVVFPLVFQFIAGTMPEGIQQAPDITEYLDFVLAILFAFGVAFEVPIATVLLVWTGVTTPQSLASKRPYLIVSAFVVGMLLTPPDIISQTLLALPMWILFEIGLIFSRIYVRDKNEKDATENEEKAGSEDQPAADLDEEYVADPALDAEIDELADYGEKDFSDTPEENGP